MTLFRFLAICLTLQIVSGLVNSNDVCGPNWIKYKDEKCLHLIQKFVTYEEAKTLCEEQIGGGTDSSSSEMEPLLTTKSKEEHDAIRRLLFQNLKINGNVWLGVERNGENGDFLEHSNEADPPKNCSVITSGDKRTEGLWKAEDCTSRNLVLCQNVQTWSTSQLQKTLLLLRDELERKSRGLDKLEKKVKDFENNLVPIGFIYMQIPGHPDPLVIWPSVTWTDVSHLHAGNFFRVIGGNSSDFGSTQPSSTGGLQEFRRQTVDIFETVRSSDYHNISMEPYAYSTWRTQRLFTGSNLPPAEAYSVFLDFLVSSEEPRPVNQAVRIWRRSA